MRVGIDVTATMMVGGIAEYTRHLVQALHEVGEEHDFVLFASFFPFRRSRRHLHPITQRLSRKLSLLQSQWLDRWWRCFGGPQVELFTGAVDVFHTPNLLLPISKAKRVVTIPDLAFLRFPQFFGHENYYARYLPDSLRRATLIIAISVSTKHDLMEYYGVPGDKLRVVYCGLAEELGPAGEDEVKRVLAKYSIDRPYVLFLGVLEPRKNIPALLEAFGELRRAAHHPHKLVVAGPRGWLYEDIFLKARELKSQIIFTGYIPPADRAALLSGAELFVYPSLWEGFGLPPLEAMACGVPVVASKVSSLPEVVGDAAILVDPYSVKEIVEAMDKVLSNEGLRSSMVARGLKRAKMFSWEKAARETLRVYEEACSA